MPHYTYKSRDTLDPIWMPHDDPSHWIIEFNNARKVHLLCLERNFFFSLKWILQLPNCSTYTSNKPYNHMQSLSLRFGTSGYHHLHDLIHLINCIKILQRVYDLPSMRTNLEVGNNQQAFSKH